ncbi:MAG: hypothetical protein PHS06_03165 [Candidatus Shapirobacteria bacterium]|nr:hypothetical protein [Candidatus Shapirobacteria bacterium]
MNHLSNKLLAYTLTGPGIQPGSSPVSALEKIISSIIGILTIVGVVYFTIQIILAGFSLIASQGDPKEFQTSKKRLTSNVIGLVIIIIAYGLGALIASLLGMSSIFDLSTVFKPI